MSRSRIASVAILLAVAIGVAVLVVRRDTDSLDRARQIVAEDARFDSGAEAGEALGDAAQQLLQAARACSDAGSEGCDAIATAAGYTRVAAAAVLPCTAPGRADVRRAVLAAIEAADKGRPVRPEPLPQC